MNLSVRDLFAIIFYNIWKENTEIDDNDDDYSADDMMMIVPTLGAVFK